jgi:hypothetical protein
MTYHSYGGIKRYLKITFWESSFTRTTDSVHSLFPLENISKIIKEMLSLYICIFAISSGCGYILYMF